MINIYSVNNYTFGNAEEDSNEKQVKIGKYDKMRSLFETQGTVHSVRAVFLIHNKKHPNIFVFLKKSDNSLVIPGGKLEVGEDEEEGLKRVLKEKVIPSGDFEILDHICTWYRPQFSSYMYPYLPVHISTPKEIEKWFIVTLNENQKLTIPAKYIIKALPSYEINSNNSYGTQLSTLPSLLSKFDFSFKE